MEPHLEAISEQQKNTWNKFSAGWKKWDDITMDWLKPMGDEIIRMLRLNDTDRVLDVASGTGEPGLTIATRVPHGKVVLTDLAQDMLAVAQENADSRGLSNIETRVCDVSQLPFEDNSFDAISCRFGFMFFPDMLLAAKELARVLKPGGRLATAVWDIPEKNFWVTATMGTINKNMQLPAAPQGAPGIFRCANAGLMTDLFAQAGLKNTVLSEVEGLLNCGTSEVYWELMNEIAAPVVAGLSKADEAMKAKIKAEVFQALSDKYPDGKVIINSSALVIYGEK